MDRLPKDAIQGPPRTDWGNRDAATAVYWAQRTAAYHGIVTWSPTIDPEALKTLSMRMVDEAKVRLLLHAWCTAPIVKERVVQGAIFESKEGRHAIVAKVVVDTTGDADLVAAAGAQCETDIDASDIHHCMNTVFLFGGVDMERWLAFRRDEPEAFAAFMAFGRERVKFFEKPFVSWRNDVALFLGPRLAGYSAINVEDLTTVELRSRELAVGHLEVYRAAAPGFSEAFLMLGAPQIGVRHSRRLAGLRKVTRQQWDTGQVWDDENRGYRRPWRRKFPNISVPYGSLLPESLDNILGAGRHVACDASSHTFLREIPQCWLTVQAAGVAAAPRRQRSAGGPVVLPVTAQSSANRCVRAPHLSPALANVVSIAPNRYGSRVKCHPSPGLSRAAPDCPRAPVRALARHSL